MITPSYTASDMFDDFTMTIGGRGVAGASRYEVLNPATEQVFATAPDCSEAELDQAVACNRIRPRRHRLVIGSSTSGANLRAPGSRQLLGE
jgi:hypothetical protein